MDKYNIDVTLQWRLQMSANLLKGHGLLLEYKKSKKTFKTSCVSYYYIYLQPASKTCRYISTADFPPNCFPERYVL